MPARLNCFGVLDQVGVSLRRLLHWQTNIRRFIAFITFVALVPRLGTAQSVLDESEERVIHYESNEGLADPVTELQKQIATGSAPLNFETNRGYLPSLLQALNIPISSQTLVFSRTSSQRAHTSPATPRAIYFSDTVSVGWCQGAEDIDIASIDPQRGPIFYTLHQSPAASATFTRRTDCMQCHLGPKTSHVPGLLVRSYFTTSNGTPLATVNEFLNGHDAPILSRWGGWYVTGQTADPHLGNIFVPSGQPANELELARVAKVSSKDDLMNSLAMSPYLSSGSDIVALLVLEHQSRMQNLITHARYETLLALAEFNDAKQSATASASEACRARIARAGDLLLEYMLFRHETPLKGPVRGSSAFAQDFQISGPRDHQGQSLRELDLNTRLFRYPCSFLIYSPSFDALPEQMKQYLWTRLQKILAGQDQAAEFAGMNATDRQALLQILSETKPEFASFVKQEYSRR